MKTKSFLIILSLYLLAGLFCSGIAQTTTSKYGASVNPDNLSYLEDPSLLRLQKRAFAGMDLAVIPSINKLDEYVTRSHVVFKLGYRTKFNMVSGAIGVEFTDEMFMPVIVEYKRYFSTEKWAPYAYASAGLSWHLKGNMESHYSTSNYPEVAKGVLASAGVGYSVTTIMNEFYFSIGYAYREYVESRFISWSEERETDMSMHGVSLTIGLTF